MIGEAAAAAPEMVARWLERADKALCFDLKKERFGGGPRFSPIRVGRRTVVTTAGIVTFSRRYYRDESTGRCCHPLDEIIGLSPRSRVRGAMIAGTQLWGSPTETERNHPLKTGREILWDNDFWLMKKDKFVCGKKNIDVVDIIWFVEMRNPQFP